MDSTFSNYAIYIEFLMEVSFSSINLTTFNELRTSNLILFKQFSELISLKVAMVTRVI